MLSVAGVGVYRIGASLAALTAAGHIDWTVPACGAVVHAGATGSWAGVVLLAFRDGRLVEVGTATAPPAPRRGDGRHVLRRAGGDLRPARVVDPQRRGDAEAYLVRVGSRVELFTGHPIRPGVGYFQVGPATFVERNFRQSVSC
ncbi:hypothetical protein NKG94_18815 [Micromonospora sp. M12]